MLPALHPTIRLTGMDCSSRNSKRETAATGLSPPLDNTRDILGCLGTEWSEVNIAKSHCPLEACYKTGVWVGWGQIVDKWR